MGSSSFGDYSYSSAAVARGEMCMEIGGGRGMRRGGGGGSRTADGRSNGKATKQQKQPQRGLGVAQLEKIRLHNQMLAAYRSAAATSQPHLHDDAAASTTAAAMVHHLVPPTAAVGGSSFHPYHHPLTDHRNRCFEETDHHGGGGVLHYYDGLLPPYRTSPPAPTTPSSLYAHDVRDSSGHRLGQPSPSPQQHYWMMSSRSDGASADELDLELRL